MPPRKGMKRRILVLLIGMSLLRLGAMAQKELPYPNESWNNGNYYEPNDWYSSNDETLLKYGMTSVSEGPGVSGSGVLLQTFVRAEDTVRAFISNTKGVAKKGQGGRPFAEKVVGMHGYYSYNLLDDDTARLLVVFKKRDTIISMTNYKIRGSGKQSGYLPFTFPIKLDVAPDTVIVEASLRSIATRLGRKEGSFLSLDSLSFIGNGKMILLPNGNFEDWVLHRMK